MTEISWTAPEFIHYPKSKLWLIVLTVIGLGLAVYFLLQKEFLTATLFFVGWILTFYFAKVKPRPIKIILGEMDVKLNETRVPYQNIKTFWMVYEPPHVKTLNFETTAYLNRYITIQMEKENPLTIREFLLKHLPEDTERQEQLSDQLSRTLKF